MKILMIIAKNNFRDEEFQIPYNYFISKKIDVKIASTKKGICIGEFGTKVNADISLDDVRTEEYKAIIIIGGPGSKDFDEDEELERILIEAKEKQILLAAICRASVILAKANVIKGKKATVYPDKENIETLKSHGVLYQKSSVAYDNNLITAESSELAEQFAVLIMSHL